MNFIRNIFSKLFSAIFFFGLLLVSVGFMEMFDNRNLSSEPVAVNIENLSASSDSSRKYIAVSGGRLDIDNTLEKSYALKGAEGGLSMHLYTPVFNENDELVFVFKTDDVEALALGTTKDTLNGLMLEDGIMEDDRYEMEEIFGQGNFFVVDNTYKDQTFIEQILGMKNSIFIVLFGLIGLVIFRDRRKKVIDVVAEEEEVIES